MEVSIIFFIIYMVIVGYYKEFRNMNIFKVMIYFMVLFKSFYYIEGSNILGNF